MALTHRIIRLRQLADGDSTMRDRLIDSAHFTRQNVIDATGVAAHQLHNWVSRKWLTLSGDQTPGKGRRRLYTGGDTVSVALGLELQPFGMMQVADMLSRSQQVSNRARRMLLDPAFECGRAFAVVPSAEREWRYVPFGPGTARSANYFRAAVILDIDRIILEVLERLLALAKGEHLDPKDSPSYPQASGGELIAEDAGDEFVFRPGSYAGL